MSSSDKESVTLTAEREAEIRERVEDDSRFPIHALYIVQQDRILLLAALDAARRERDVAREDAARAESAARIMQERAVRAERERDEARVDRDALRGSCEAATSAVLTLRTRAEAAEAALDAERARGEAMAGALRWYADSPPPGDFRIVDRDGETVSDMSEWGDRARQALTAARPRP